MQNSIIEMNIPEPMATHPVRKAGRRRGFGMLETVVGVAILLSATVGGTLAVRKVYRDQIFHDLVVSSQYVRSLVAMDARNQKSLPVGDIRAIYQIDLPGFSRDEGGNFQHRWADNVTLRHVGGYVVEMHLDGLGEAECNAIAGLADRYLGANYKGFVTIEDQFFTDPYSADNNSLVRAACSQTGGVLAGWTFAPRAESIIERTSLSPAAGADPDAGGSDPDAGGSDPGDSGDGGQGDGGQTTEPGGGDTGPDDGDAGQDGKNCGNNGNGNSGSGGPGNPNPGTGNCGVGSGGQNGNSGSNGNGGGQTTEPDDDDAGSNDKGCGNNGNGNSGSGGPGNPNPGTGNCGVGSGGQNGNSGGKGKGKSGK